MLVSALVATGCVSYVSHHEIQSNSLDQIGQAELSQVKVRNAQSRVLDTSDRLRTVEAVVATFQDLGFQVEVLDETLGIVSGKKYLELERPSAGYDASYFLYNEESLVALTRAYRGWGPFWHRSDLVRLTVTVRPRNENQLIVRASAQFYLQAIEEPEAYQAFFRALEQVRFSEQHLRDR